MWKLGVFEFMVQLCGPNGKSLVETVCVLLKSGKSQWFRIELEQICLAEAVNERQKYPVGCCSPMDHQF